MPNEARQTVCSWQLAMLFLCAVTAALKKRYQKKAVAIVAGNSASCKLEENWLLVGTSFRETQQATASPPAFSVIAVKSPQKMCPTGRDLSFLFLRQQLKRRRDYRAHWKLRARFFFLFLVMIITQERKSNNHKEASLTFSPQMTFWCLLNCLGEIYSNGCSSKQRVHGSGVGCPYKEWFVVMLHRINERFTAAGKNVGSLWGNYSAGVPATEVSGAGANRPSWCHFSCLRVLFQCDER